MGGTGDRDGDVGKEEGGLIPSPRYLLQRWDSKTTLNLERRTDIPTLADLLVVLCCLEQKCVSDFLRSSICSEIYSAWRHTMVFCHSVGSQFFPCYLRDFITLEFACLNFPGLFVSFSAMSFSFFFLLFVSACFPTPPECFIFISHFSFAFSTIIRFYMFIDL